MTKTNDGCNVLINRSPRTSQRCVPGGPFYGEKHMQLKNPATYEEQIAALKKKFPVEDEEDCKAFLSRVNYYRFSAYYLPFKDENGMYRPDITFNRIKNIYFFDQELRGLVFRAIEGIETNLKAQISYYHSFKYGPEGYREALNYNQRHDHKKFLAHVDNEIDENRKSLVVKHHNEVYQGHFPIWVIIDFFSIGTLSYFYIGMKRKDKKSIAKSLYDTNDVCLESWLRCLTDLRNKCAHYSRLYYWNFAAIPKMTTNDNFITTRHLFSQLYMLKKMYPNAEKWNEIVIEEMSNIIEKYQDYISLDHIDFPENWKEILLKE